VIIIEDIHWLDEASVEFVSALVDIISVSRVLLILTYRPTFPVPWTDGAGFHEIRLDELRDEDVSALTMDLIGDHPSIRTISERIVERSGGNPFDNRNIIYSGTPDDNALNDGVKRYASSPRANEYLHTYYTPTGRLTRPMLAIHTTYDPLVPPWIPNAYSVLTETMGTMGMFVQQYVKHDGHCAINNTEVSRGFAELREWKNRGVRPVARRPASRR
jgi:hypothetical protein